MLTESHFRGAAFRIGELVFAVLALSVGFKKPRVTLGKCQVGLRYWQELFGFRRTELIRAVLDDVCNYDVCCYYLQKVSCENLREAAIHYNGKPSQLYVKLLQENL
ncbi:unnamed protein product, partial [Phaeothamnion confervicola]